MCTGPFLGMLLTLTMLEKRIETKELETYYIDLEKSVIINDCRTFPNTYFYLKDSDVV